MGAQAFLDKIEKLTGVPAIFYITRTVHHVPKWATFTDNRNCPLWLAGYVHNIAKYVPRAWTDWGHLAVGLMKTNCPGTPLGAEQDYFKGSLADLQKLDLRVQSCRTHEKKARNRSGISQSQLWSFQPKNRDLDTVVKSNCLSLALFWLIAG